jgi:hypothetical protein
MVGASRQARSNLRKELMTAHTVARLVIERPMEIFFLAAHDRSPPSRCDRRLCNPVRRASHAQLGNACCFATVPAADAWITSLKIDRSKRVTQNSRSSAPWMIGSRLNVQRKPKKAPQLPRLWFLV